MDDEKMKEFGFIIENNFDMMKDDLQFGIRNQMAYKYYEWPPKTPLVQKFPMDLAAP